MKHSPSLSEANGPRPLGFPQDVVLQAPTVIVTPTPLPKRPKGRWFVGFILIGICAVAVYSVWNSFFRYEAYGVVSGRVIDVSPPWDGVVRSLLVRDGDAVEQGQLIMTLENIELRQRHAQLADELLVAQANLEAEVGKLKWQSAFGTDQSHGAIAFYYETLGEYLREQARLDELRTQLRRSTTLYASRSVSQEEYQTYLYATQGQEKKVARLKIAVEDLKKRADLFQNLFKDGSLKNTDKGMEAAGAAQLKPSLVRITTLEAERQRLQDRMDEGLIRSPVNGRLIKSYRFAGERCRSIEPVLSVLERGSLEVVLYMPQNSRKRFDVGEEAQMVFEPYMEPLGGTVKRVGDRFESAPEQIKRHYTEGQRMLPIYVSPTDEATTPWLALRVGGVVKLPYDSRSLLSFPGR
jgi:multidrug resistance efflux pump